jgi:hypothetical protein
MPGSNDINYVLPDLRRRPRKGEKAPKPEPIPQFKAMDIPNATGHANLPDSYRLAYDIFSLFFSDTMLEVLAQNINLNAKIH